MDPRPAIAREGSGEAVPEEESADVVSGGDAPVAEDVLAVTASARASERRSSLGRYEDIV